MLAMFMGEFSHTLDKKGRIAIPAKLREGLGDKFVLTRGLDSCLYAYPFAEWSQWHEKLKKLPMTKSKARAYQRIVYSGAVDVEKDKQGRILIPQNLREHARLVDNVVVIGVSDHVEIWAEDVWRQYSTEANEGYEDIAEDLNDFDL